VHYGLGRIETARGNHAAAARHYASAIELFDAYGAAHYALALAYRNLGDAPKARAQLAAYDRHKMGAPPLPDPFLDRVDALQRGAARHLSEGVALGTGGQIEEAVREHENALTLDPTLAQAHIHLITLYGRKGDFEAAERHYKAAVGLNSHLADAHYNYGVLLVYAGRHREAAEAFRKAIDVNPYYAPAHNNLGQILEQGQRFDEAAQHYSRAVEHDPQYRVARFNLGRVLVALNRPREAIDHFLRILEPSDEATPRYLFALAAAYVRIGDVASARKYGVEAQRRAEQLGQHDLATAIAKDLQKLKP
jgi:tetratricopeptide (TPR) repeat protein